MKPHWITGFPTQTLPWPQTFMSSLTPSFQVMPVPGLHCPCGLVCQGSSIFADLPLQPTATHITVTHIHHGSVFCLTQLWRFGDPKAIPTVRIPPWGRAGTKENRQKWTFAGKDFQSACSYLKECPAQSIFGEKKIICRSSLFWLFVDISKFLLGGPWSVAGGKENPHLGGQLVFSRLSSSWGALRGRAVFGCGPGPGSVGRNEAPLRHSSGCWNPAALRYVSGHTLSSACLLGLLWQPVHPLFMLASPCPTPVSSITNTSTVGLFRFLPSFQRTWRLQAEDQNILPCQIPKSETVRSRDPKGTRLTFSFSDEWGVTMV